MDELATPATLRQQVERIHEIATLPHVMQRILDTIGDETTSAADLSREIAADPSLTAKILKIVNSAYYGFHRQVLLLSDAIVLLGFEEVKRISLAAGVLGMFGPNSPQDRERIRLWHHSFDTAAIAALIEQETDASRRGAFTAGLLHDIGRLVLDQYFPDLYAVVLSRQQAEQRSAADVERKLLGVTHADIGYWLVERWGLPPVLTQAIRFHPWPSDANGDIGLAAVVHIAEVLAHRIRTANIAEPHERRIDPAALAVLGYDEAALAALTDKATRKIATRDDVLSELLLA